MKLKSLYHIIVYNGLAHQSLTMMTRIIEMKQRFADMACDKDLSGFTR